MPFVDWYWVVLGVGLVSAVGVGISGMFITTPYGRFASKKLGPELPIKLGWFIMEFPALPTFFAMFALGTNRSTAASSPKFRGHFARGP